MITVEKNKRKHDAAADDAAEKLLAKKIFGGRGSSSNDEESSGEEEEMDEVVVENLIKETEASPSPEPVWHDEDDDELIVNLPSGKRSAHLRRATDIGKQKISAKDYEERLREAFNQRQGAARSKLKWAAIDTVKSSEKTKRDDGSDYEDVEETLKDMVAFSGRFTGTSKYLPKGLLNVQRLNDITRGHRFGKKPITAVQFHPTKSVLMTGSESGVISLFEIGVPPNEEAFLQDAHFKNFPITTARFSADGLKVFAGSRRQVYLYSYDLLSGHTTQMRTPTEMTHMSSGVFTLSSDGIYMAVVTRNEINILAIATMELVCALPTSSVVTALQFSPSSSNCLFALTENSEIFIWDIRNPGERQNLMDDGGVKGSVMRISYNDQFLACASNTGIVNLYEMKDVYKSSSPTPVKVFDQLTTCVNDIVFNKDSQLFLMSSNVKKNAARLVHTRSRTVFSNFPPRKVNIGNATVSDFSPNSGYLAVGDIHGYLSLFRLYHFTDY